MVLGAGLLASTALLAQPIQGQNDTFEWSGRMTSGQTLEVKGIVGNIRATLASGDRAEVVATKRGEEEDFHQVAVEMAEDGDRIIICAVYGEWNHGEGQCHPDHEDRDDDEEHRNVDMDVEVDYEVRLPAGVEFEGIVVSGDIEAEGLRSDISVKTVDGNIAVETTERAWANTVSGDMEIQMGQVGRGDLDFNTVSGDITLWLPADISADVEFHSLSGDFDTDFDIDITSQKDLLVGSRVEGTIGGGGREINLNTVSGNVELRRIR
jgi:DUF4097 and DUF4098 domain-containing protein YvlB